MSRKRSYVRTSSDKSLFSSPRVRANLTTLESSDFGYVELKGFEQGQDKSIITGRVEELTNELFIEATKKSPFTLRYLDPKQNGLVEYTGCQMTNIFQRGIEFQVTQDKERVLPIPQGDEELTYTMFSEGQTLARQYTQIVFVLGAGASINMLPAGTNILLKTLEASPNSPAQRFIEDVFGANVTSSVPFPSFNQVLNVIDIALEREENFSATYDLDALRAIKRDLVSKLRQFLIDSTNQPTDSAYLELCKNLKKYIREGNKVSFITLNYDLFLDWALTKTFGQGALDFVVPFTDWGGSVAPSGVREIGEETNEIEIVKLHGSLDWMICPTCFSAYRFSSSDLQKSLSERKCKHDNSTLQEFLFPPTRERVEVHSHWISLQARADHLLRHADKAVFVGFSLSEDDAYLRFKLKKHLYRGKNPVSLQVVGAPRSEYDLASNTVARLYWQFFGPIDYRPSGFKDFAASPY